MEKLRRFIRFESLEESKASLIENRKNLVVCRVQARATGVCDYRVSFDRRQNG